MNSLDELPDQTPILEVWSPRGPTDFLSEDECWALLSAAPLGRLAVAFDGQPAIFPVTHVVDDGLVLFRTAGGAKLDELRANPRVAFEVDSREGQEAWSVAIRGVARVITDQDVIDRADRAPLPEWVPTERYVWVGITVLSITGRRVWYQVHPVRRH